MLNCSSEVQPADAKSEHIDSSYVNHLVEVFSSGLSQSVLAKISRNNLILMSFLGNSQLSEKAIQLNLDQLLVAFIKDAKSFTVLMKIFDEGNRYEPWEEFLYALSTLMKLLSIEDMYLLLRVLADFSADEKQSFVKGLLPDFAFKQVEEKQDVGPSNTPASSRQALLDFLRTLNFPSEAFFAELNEFNEYPLPCLMQDVLQKLHKLTGSIGNLNQRQYFLNLDQESLTYWNIILKNYNTYNFPLTQSECKDWYRPKYQYQLKLRAKFLGWDLLNTLKRFGINYIHFTKIVDHCYKILSNINNNTDYDYLKTIDEQIIKKISDNDLQCASLFQKLKAEGKPLSDIYHEILHNRLNLKQEAKLFAENLVYFLSIQNCVPNEKIFIIAFLTEPKGRKIASIYALLADIQIQNYYGVDGFNDSTRELNTYDKIFLDYFLSCDLTCLEDFEFILKKVLDFHFRMITDDLDFLIKNKILFLKFKTIMLLIDGANLKALGEEKVGQRLVQFISILLGNLDYCYNLLIKGKISPVLLKGTNFDFFLLKLSQNKKMEAENFIVALQQAKEIEEITQIPDVVKQITAQFKQWSADHKINSEMVQTLINLKDFCQKFILTSRLQLFECEIKFIILNKFPSLATNIIISIRQAFPIVLAVYQYEHLLNFMQENSINSEIFLKDLQKLLPREPQTGNIKEMEKLIEGVKIKPTSVRSSSSQQFFVPSPVQEQKAEVSSAKSESHGCIIC